MARIALEHVDKIYPNGYAAARDLSLEIHDGELLVLVGPSGSGKSTVLRMMAGLEQVTAGAIRIGDRDVTDLPPQQRDIAMVFQNYALYPHMTVRENLGFGLMMRKQPRDVIDRRVQAVAASLGLDVLLDRKPAQLSGGQRQRVALGRAIVREPLAFLFDEPLSNLDALLRAEMRVEIKKLHHRLGNTIIYVTHDQVEAMTLADRIVVLQAGNLVQYDTPDGIYNRPAAKFVAGFTGSPPMNFAPCRVGEGGRTLHLPAGLDLPVPDNRVAECARHHGRVLTFGLRPEHLGAAGGPDGGRPGDHRVDGKVTLVEPLGAETLGLIRLGEGDDAPEMTGRFPPEAKLSVGQSLPVMLSLANFHLFDPDSGAAIRGAGW